ncbi:MAG TPA: hypothetical protein PKC77_11425 [Sphingopyxis sp.]|nr:hypothetical protein [Sphingopyxis sp.]
MPYREKIAWLTLGSMIVAYSLYFGLILAGHPAGREMFPMLWLFGSIAATQALVVIAGHIVLATTTPRAERRRRDERDRAIGRRGAAAAYYVMMAGMILVGVVMPFTDTGVKIANAALFAIVLAETVSLTVVLLSYRRGWHG